MPRSYGSPLAILGVSGAIGCLASAIVPCWWAPWIPDGRVDLLGWTALALYALSTAGTYTAALRAQEAKQVVWVAFAVDTAASCMLLLGTYFLVAPLGIIGIRLILSCTLFRYGRPARRTLATIGGMAVLASSVTSLGLTMVVGEIPALVLIEFAIGTFLVALARLALKAARASRLEPAL